MSSKLNSGICYAYTRGGAAWGILTELKADMVLFAGSTVWSIFERVMALLLYWVYCVIRSICWRRLVVRARWIMSLTHWKKTIASTCCSLKNYAKSVMQWFCAFFCVCSFRSLSLALVTDCIGKTTSRDRQFRDTPAALRFGFCVQNIIWFSWSQI